MGRVLRLGCTWVLTIQIRRVLNNGKLGVEAYLEGQACSILKALAGGVLVGDNHQLRHSCMVLGLVDHIETVEVVTWKRPVAIRSLCVP